MHTGSIDRTGATPVVTQTLSGLTGQTFVLTLDGEMPVDQLTPGDRVITRSSGMAVLKELRRTVVEMAPVSIKSGSLGHTRPDKDMIVGPDAMILIRDWRAEALFNTKMALVPAHRLTDGEFVTDLPKRKVAMYELVFDRQHIVYADGVEVASAEV